MIELRHTESDAALETRDEFLMGEAGVKRVDVRLSTKGEERPPDSGDDRFGERAVELDVREGLWYPGAEENVAKVTDPFARPRFDAAVPYVVGITAYHELGFLEGGR